MGSNTYPTHRAKARRQRRVRKKVTGTSERPRLAVFRSNRHISVQLIDDSQGVTLASASTYTAGAKAATGSSQAATEVGTTIGEKAKAAGITQVVFDRGGNKYHGRVAALADAARESGLEF